MLSSSRAIRVKNSRIFKIASFGWDAINGRFALFAKRCSVLTIYRPSYIHIYIYIFKTIVIHEDRKEERWSEIDFQSLEFDVVVTNGIKRANRLCPR